MIPIDELLDAAERAAVRAGQLIASYRDREVAVEHKEAGHTLASQVVTEVDAKAQDEILHCLLPTCEAHDLGLLSEEREDDRDRLEKDFFWCIDPMDGTLSFVQGKPGYAVSIALVARDGVPVIGVVYDPVNQVLYRAAKDRGLQRNGAAWQPEAQGATLGFNYDRSLVDHPHYETLLGELESLARARGLDGLKAAQHGGSVMNACDVLDRAPACHFKFPKPQDGGGSLWDYAATACLFNEAGAVVSDIHGRPLDLNRADSTFMNHRGALYASDEAIAAGIRALAVRYC